MPLKSDKVNQKLVDLVTALNQNVKNIGQSVGKHVDDVLGPDFGAAKDLAKDTLDVSKNMTLGFIKFFAFDKLVKNRTARTTEKLLDSQKEAVKLLKSERFDRMRNVKTKKGGLGVLGAILFSLGASLGAVIGLILLPFKVLAKAVQTGLAPLIKILSKTGVFAKMAAWFTGLKTFMLKLPGMAKLTEGLLKLKKLALTFAKMPVVKHLLKAFKFGFKKVLWPIQIVLSAVDFIKGWMSSQGDILSKMKAGVKSVITGFFGWPLEMMEKLFNWISSSFGFEKLKIESGTLLNGVLASIDFFYSLTRGIFNGIKNSVSGVTSFIKGIDFSGLTETITSIGAWISEIQDTIISAFDFIAAIIEKASTYIDGALTGFIDSIKNNKLVKFFTGDSEELNFSPAAAKTNLPTVLEATHREIRAKRNTPVESKSDKLLKRVAKSLEEIEKSNEEIANKETGTNIIQGGNSVVGGMGGNAGINSFPSTDAVLGMKNYNFSPMLQKSH